MYIYLYALRLERNDTHLKVGARLAFIKRGTSA